MISVLIPAYNVAPYLDECLDSVVRNSDTQEIEVVVCVDGRSTDTTASIVRRYAERYPYVRACIEGIEGVGRLRNRALELARGSQLMFVDADDSLPEGAIDVLSEAMTAGVDAVFGCLRGRKSRSHVRQVRAMGGEEAAEAILYQRRLKEGLHCSVWAKLWRAAVWRGVRFPEDILYEDLATVPLVACRCRQVALVGQEVYFYRRRTGSILHTFTSLRFTSIKAAGLLLSESPSASFSRAARNRQLSAAFNVLRLMVRHRRLMNVSLLRLGISIAAPVIRQARGETLVNPGSRVRLRIASLLSYLFF